MARGWESKSVESQIEAAQDRRSRPREVVVTPEQARYDAERTDLEQSRARVLRDLETAANPRYRELLTTSLEFLDEKIKALGERP